MMRHGIFMAAALLALSAVTGDLAAAPEGERSFPDLVIQDTGPAQERALRAVLTIHMWKMTEAVRLSEEQAAQLFPKIREAFRTQWQAEGKRRQLLRLLQRVSDSAPPRKERLEQLLAQWGENEEKLHAAQQEMMTAVRRVLTPMQQVKYLLFQEQFQGELTRVIADFRREQAQSHGEPKGPGER